jgi:hypothetical protein
MDYVHCGHSIVGAGRDPACNSAGGWEQTLMTVIIGGSEEP